MATHRFAPWFASGFGALLVVAVGWMAPLRSGLDLPVPEHRDAWEVRTLLTQLEQECEPDSPMNDYAWSSNAPPTERHRRQMLERFHEIEAVALAEVHARLRKPRDDEFGEMLVVIASAMGDKTLVPMTARLMAYSEHPAVRLCAARELRRLRDPRTTEWFDYAANNDDRRVRNDGCGRAAEFFYPVRTVAALALKEMGIEFKSTEQLQRENEMMRREQELRRLRERIIEAHTREMEAARKKEEPTPRPPPSVPAGGTPPRTR